MKHTLQDEYLKRLGKFEQANPPAFRFMKRLELEGPEHGMWLSTVSNAHLYKEDGYLAYFQLRSTGAKPPALVLSPDPNHYIEGDAKNRSAMLFPRPIERLVMAHKGFSAKWSLVRGATVEFYATTPDSFYEALFGALRALDMSPAS